MYNFCFFFCVFFQIFLTKPFKYMYLSVFKTKQKNVHICKKIFCTYAKFLKKKIAFSEFFFATGLVFERFLAPRSRFFEKVNGLGDHKTMPIITVASSITSLNHHSKELPYPLMMEVVNFQTLVSCYIAQQS
ncbi:hypothetical protein LXL04_010440 [Taraxacum kok-saghyz]